MYLSCCCFYINIQPQTRFITTTYPDAEFRGINQQNKTNQRINPCCCDDERGLERSKARQTVYSLPVNLTLWRESWKVTPADGLKIELVADERLD